MPTTRNLTILIFEGVEVPDFCGPFEVFTAANRFTDPRQDRPRPLGHGEAVERRRGGLSANPRRRLADSPRPDLRRDRVWSVRPILSYRSRGRLRGGAERPLVSG